jgi:iron complex outermembrane recepter protein
MEREMKYRINSSVVRHSVAMLCGVALMNSALAQEKPKSSDVLEEVIVTGSLIPQSKVETATPVTVITADDLQARGYANIADALQQTSFSTGSVQGPQFSYGFTQGAQTLSMFGLSPSYVKYLIDGLPMSDYPALYNGTDTFVSIGGIPMSLVERIDILPGGQSSLYGSDAIAGVVNVVMKKKIDGLTADARFGRTSAGGGNESTFSLANGASFGALNVMGGIQYDDTKPIWGYQRGLTSQYNANGTTPQTAERDYLVYGLFGPTGNGANAYYFSDPANCANVSSLFGGTDTLRSRPNRGEYCGTTSAGYYTLNNGAKNAEIYGRATLELNSHAEIYSDLLMSNDTTYYSNGGQAYVSYFDPTSPYAYYYDPNKDDFMNVQHIFAPEEIGNLDKTYSYSITNSWRATLGSRGKINSGWSYDVSASYNVQKLTEKTFTLLSAKIENFYSSIFGANLGPDPYGFGSNTYTPNYANFYKPLTQDQYSSLTGFFVNHSLTEASVFRAQLTNAELYKLPGGEAGIALVAEGGRQAWEYVPDTGFASNQFFGFTSSGASYGSRTRSAFTTELRLPVIEMLTINASARYDNYKLSDSSLSKTTYNIGLEFRPLQSLLLRARYGTAFKAPTLSDEYQGISGFYTGATDYYQCTIHGYTGANLANCPYPSGGSVFGQTSGNTALKPINANVWNAGLVWAPIDRLSFNVDYLHWMINNEVSQQSSDQLLRDEAACRLGQLDIHSPTCVNALNQVKRDGGLQLLSIYIPKVNVSQEALDALSITSNYFQRAGEYGTFKYELSYTDMLKHSYQQYAGDPFIDLLNNPYYSTEFKTRINGSVSWEKEQFNTTASFIRNGRTPNYLAQLYTAGFATPGAGLLNPYTQINLSVRYAVRSDLQLSATIVNMFNAMPPFDGTYNGLTNQPYNVFNYNPYGRAFRLELKYFTGK